MRCLDLDDFPAPVVRRQSAAQRQRFLPLVPGRLWFAEYMHRSDNLLFSDNRLWQRQICFTLPRQQPAFPEDGQRV